MNTQTNPVGAGVLISAAVKTTLLALAAVHVIPWDGEQIAIVTLAASSLADLGIYLGFIRPRLQQATEYQAEHRANEIIDALNLQHPDPRV